MADLTFLKPLTHTEDDSAVPNIVNNYRHYHLTKLEYEKIRTWAQTHGYADAITPINDGKRKHVSNAATGADWWDAILIANAYSEMQGFTAYYLDEKSLPIRQRLTFHYQKKQVFTQQRPWQGYRIPTLEEWMSAREQLDTASVETWLFDVFDQHIPWMKMICSLRYCDMHSRSFRTDASGLYLVYQASLTP